MKTSIIIHPKTSRSTLIDFCNFHQLIIHVNERDPETRAWGREVEGATVAGYRYYAYILHLEVAENETIYSSPFGNGNTVKAAIRDLAKVMSNKEVRVDHRFLRVPKLLLK